MAPVIAADYVLGDVAGIGGMGIIYRAHRTGEPATLAIKVVKDELADDPWVARRFRNEATIGRMLSHPNIARVIDHGRTAAGVPYLVMEWVGGESLSVAISANGPMSLRTAVSITSQVLGALGHAHERGVVHADVKSDNILVREIGQDVHATLIDFGLAHAIGHPPPRAKQMISGTPEFMAPEVIRGEPATPASDLYAVGVMLYELLTGTTPFGGGPTAEIFARHLEDEVVPPSLRCQDREIPAALEEVVQRALAKHPADRYASAAAFDSALAAAIVRAPVEARRPSRSPVARAVFSAESSTADWSRHGMSHRPRRARGTQPRDSAAVALARQDVHAAPRDQSRELAAAYLKLACALVEDHRLGAAATELEAAIEAIANADALWPVQLTLAAIYDGLRDRRRARVTAVASRSTAVRARSTTGIYRADVLIERLTSRRLR